MGKTIIINCAHCGEKITEISFVPGSQVLSHHCEILKNYQRFLGIGRKTEVIISNEGKVQIRPY